MALALQMLFEESHPTIAYDRLQEWLYTGWRDDQDLTSVQSGCREMLRLLIQCQCRKVLNDNARVTSMWSDAAEWGGSEWLPAMTAAGLQYFAWVYSPNTYSRLSTDFTLQYTGSGPITATFDDLETATAWLKQL